MSPTRETETMTKMATAATGLGVTHSHECIARSSLCADRIITRCWGRVTAKTFNRLLLWAVHGGKGLPPLRRGYSNGYVCHSMLPLCRLTGLRKYFHFLAGYGEWENPSI